MLLRPEARQIFIDLGCEPKACSKLKTDNWDNEFLLSRLIFLTTYGTSIDLPKLIEERQLADSIVHNLSKHAARCSTEPAGKTKSDPMEKMALEETLKLLFNVTRYASNHTSSFDAATPHIATILCSLELPKTSKTILDPPVSLLINALMNLDLASPAAQPSLYSPDNQLAHRLLDLLDLSTKTYFNTDLEQSVTPLICVLSSLYEHAPTTTPSPSRPPTSSSPETSPSTRDLLRATLLPTATDRMRVLGQADTLPSRLLRNWTNPLAPEFRRAIAHFYFDLSSRDAGQFVENVGYGYASGFLFENKIPVPDGVVKDGEAKEGRREVNPITGQFVEEERFPEVPEMTVEEKEREAERLFVLFER